MLIEMAARSTVDAPPVGLELLFTVAEEQGLRGAAAFDQSQLGPRSVSSSITPPISGK